MRVSRQEYEGRNDSVRDLMSGPEKRLPWRATLPGNNALSDAYPPPSEVIGVAALAHPELAIEIVAVAALPD